MCVSPFLCVWFARVTPVPAPGAVNRYILGPQPPCATKGPPSRYLILSAHLTDEETRLREVQLLAPVPSVLSGSPGILSGSARHLAPSPPPGSPVLPSGPTHPLALWASSSLLKKNPSAVRLGQDPPLQEQVLPTPLPLPPH